MKRRGEKHHAACLELSRRISTGGHRTIASSLVLLELPGALASSTSMPIERIFQVEASTHKRFNLGIRSYEPYVGKATELMLALRDLKRRRKIPSADFHHLATAAVEGCDFFVAVDERHMLWSEFRGSMREHVEILDPSQAVTRV